MKIGWIGVGRMGAPMAARLLKAGYPVSIWNRTRAKAQTEELHGAIVVDAKAELAEVDVLFTMLSTGKDVIDVCFGSEGDGVPHREHGVSPGYGPERHGKARAAETGPGESRTRAPGRRAHR